MLLLPFSNQLTLKWIFWRNKRRSCNDRFLNNFSLRPWKEHVSKHDPESDEIVEPDFARAAHKAPERLPQRHRPLKTKINQQNRINVKRPLGPHENLTIFVQNNAVNSPVFVSDAQISNSNININQASTSPPMPQFSQMAYPSFTRPSYTPAQAGQLPQPISRPHPYYPQNIHDPNNPNPPYYGYTSNPVNSLVPDNAYFQNRQSYLSSLSQDEYPSPIQAKTGTRIHSESEAEDEGRVSEDEKKSFWARRNASNFLSINSSNTIQRSSNVEASSSSGLYYNDGHVLLSRKEDDSEDTVEVEESTTDEWENLIFFYKFIWWFSVT